jgi:cobalt/nickel transport system ATP-binding protein
MDLITLKDITFAYGEDEPPVLDHLSFSLAKGKCLVVEGENGAGKTTLFRILNGLSFPQSGRYLFDGIQIDRNYLKNNQNAKLFHKRIGYLFQNPDLILFNASVYDEIAFGPRQMGLKETEVQTRVEDCMNLFHLSAYRDKAPYHLSGGQKKRVALAAVMALNPEVLILDEPFAGLDQKNAENLMAFLKEMKSAGKTLIIASHHPAVKERLADEVLTLCNNKSESF